MAFRGLQSMVMAALWALTMSGVAVAQGAAKPNIVVMMSDDAGYSDFGFMSQRTGHVTGLSTPNLDLLASQSVLATQAYNASATCSVTRAGLLTGLNPQRFGWAYNALPADSPNEGFPTEKVLISDRLKQLGYKTAAIGKWHLGSSQSQWLPRNQGFDYFYGFLDGGHYYYRTAGDGDILRNETSINWWDTNPNVEPSFNNIPNDPVNGRYLTDAFGDEASKYIAQNAAASSTNPFFMYVPFYSPHSPYQAKQQDLAQFPALTGNRKNVAAMTLALDRAVGNILSRIDDPNGDGNESDSIAENTIVVFLNDNGAPTNLANNGYDNFPLHGYKGSGWEAASRTPVLIRAPGLTPGTFDTTISSLDLFPTFVAAAGGQMTTPSDGVDLMPFLTGSQTGTVHETIVQRNRVNYAFIREGEWKLGRVELDDTWRLFKLNPDGTGEVDAMGVRVDLSAQYPEIVAKLARDFVAVDVTFDKSRNSASNPNRDCDIFVRRNDVFVNANWAYASGWRNGVTNAVTSIIKDDPCPNTVLVFTPNNTADYTSSNVRNRAAGVAWSLLDQGVQDLAGTGEFMLNELRFQGDFSGDANRKATINGKPLLFVNDLSGKAPGLRLDALQTGIRTYTYQLDLDLILYNDFVIEGDGNANFQIGGVMRNFWNPSGVTKRGTSTVTLKGHNTYTGATIVEQGRIIVDGPNAALDGTDAIEVQSGGRLTLQSGLIRTGELDVGQGTFDFLGGVLQIDQVNGSLVNPTGSLVIGTDLPTGAISGNFAQTGGTLDLSLSPQVTGTTSLLTIGGQAQLGGRLVVNFDDGSVPYQLSQRLIFATGGLSGTFSEVVVPDIPPGAEWSLNYGANAVTLALNQHVTAPDSADFNGNGRIDGSDFLIWQRSFGSNGPAGDANYDGQVDAADLAVWQGQFGGTPPQSPVSQQAPEPSTLGLCCFAALISFHCALRYRPALSKPQRV